MRIVTWFGYVDLDAISTLASRKVTAVEINIGRSHLDVSELGELLQAVSFEPEPPIEVAHTPVDASSEPTQPSVEMTCLKRRVGTYVVVCL